MQEVCALPPDEGAAGVSKTTPASLKAAGDHALLAAHVAGDRRAFNELVRRYQRPVYRLALRYARDADEAEELTQRTFLRALAHAPALASGSSFRGFLFRTAANLCKNHLRDRARLVLGVPLSVAAPEDDSVEERERRQRLRACLARLPLRQRQVVALRIDAELPFSEVAEALGITENNAKVTYHYAVKKLQALLREDESGEEKERR